MLANYSAAKSQSGLKRMLDDLRRWGIADEKVLEAMGKVAREKFLPAALQAEAFDNSALPIGEKQTISQPWVVAKMTESLKLEHRHKVLEIGTGCGYQTAVLCKIVRRVFTIERIESLAKTADRRLHDMGISNFVGKKSDGTVGWPEQAPFDRIIVTAAGPQAPQALLDQLSPQGIMVMPVGDPNIHSSQKLMKYVKSEDGSLISQEYICDVKFVPLIGKQGVSES